MLGNAQRQSLAAAAGLCQPPMNWEGVAESPARFVGQFFAGRLAALKLREWETTTN